MSGDPPRDDRPAYVGSDMSHIGGSPTPLAVTIGVPHTEVGVAYLALLNRLPTDRERADAAERGLVATCRELARSDEHLARLERHLPGGFVLAGSDAALNAHPVGTFSDDDVVVVGANGQLLLHGGNNSYIPQFQGEFPLSSTWLDDWRAVVAQAQERATAAGVPLVQIIVPEKVAAQPSAYPFELSIRGPRPIELLLAGCPTIDYPLDRFQASAEPAFLATDSHLSPAAGQMMIADICDRLGLAPIDTTGDAGECLYLGDLGYRLDPGVIEACVFPAQAPTVSITDQNLIEMIAAGVHLGSYRITDNPAAPYAKRVLVFGDSFSLPPPPGVLGSFGDLLTRTFKTVHFCWAPFCWDEAIVAETQPDLIIQEGGERGIHRVPALDVDFVSLAAAALAPQAHPGASSPAHALPARDRRARFWRRRS